LNLEESANYSLEHICGFDCKPADKTAWGIQTEMPVAKSTPSFQKERTY
jgi:hypothetical protein